MLKRLQKRREGIAIIAAMGGIVVIGALIAGVFFVSTQESEISGGALVHERAFRAAELGLNSTLNAWDNMEMSMLNEGARRVFTYKGTGWDDTVIVTKLTPNAYSILSSATAGSGRLARSRKQTLLSVRTTSPDFNFLGALTVRGATWIGGSSYIDGNDKNPTTWAGCDPATGALPGIATADPNSITYSGSANTVTGSPPIKQDAAAADTATYFNFGDENWASLTRTATKVFTTSQTLSSIQPRVVSGMCDRTDPTNWGAPLHTVPPNPCENYFPVIHMKGAGNKTSLSGNIGQGILLVDGDLEISGNVEFYGPVIVRGKLTSVGTGGKINGAVMAANVALTEHKIQGNTLVNYSSCAVLKALQGSANPYRITHRAWAEVQ